MTSELIGREIKVLDKGFIRVVDLMGDDSSIVQAARVSYGKGTKTVSDDRSLIRYLMAHGHTTPFEMCEIKLHVKIPMDAWRQMIRHRTACLAADNELAFIRPCDGKAYRLTVGEVYAKFQPTANTTRPDKQKNPYFRRDRVQAMRLRCLNEDTMQPTETSVVDIWQSGVKTVYRVNLADGSQFRCSLDHKIHTPKGWKQLRDLNVGDLISCVGPRVGASKLNFNTIDPDTEEWRPIRNWENYYEVSSQGRIRRIVGGQGCRARGQYKRLTVSQGRVVTSLNRPGTQEVVLVHLAMLQAFGIEPERPDQTSVRHLDGNALNNTLENLKWGTAKENAEDMVKHGTSTLLSYVPHAIVSITPDGEEMTYDLEVSGPYHNFVVGNAVVHNSVNEVSTRYSEVPEEFQCTDANAWRSQSKTARQGSGNSISKEMGESLSLGESVFLANVYNLYKRRLAFGVAREQARKDLPLSTYTQAYWKIDLHNLFHFLSKRLPEDAQYEIRQYANAIAEIVKQWVPLAWGAFENYRLNAITLSGEEIKLIQMMNQFGDGDHEMDFPGSAREAKESKAKLSMLGFSCGFRQSQ